MPDKWLNEKYQSAYKQFHSIQTALACAANGILLCVDEKKAVLLDLSAAFDTVLCYIVCLGDWELRALLCLDSDCI